MQGEMESGEYEGGTKSKIGNGRSRAQKDQNGEGEMREGNIEVEGGKRMTGEITLHTDVENYY